tara:strand:+ start:367 stop:594 length:228 start_codon:yes stop_codon:yes gene_type:complete
MQKLFNVMAASAFLMSGVMVVGTVMLYSRIPSLTKYYLSELKLEMTQMMTQMMPKQIEEAMPELPKETGLPIPFQ